MIFDRRFFLGGQDLEMLEIGKLVRRSLGADAVVDKHLPWHGAKASAYRPEIAEAVSAGRRPVLVELEPDLPGEMLGGCTLVDHHGACAGADRPTSIEQVFGLLGLPADRWDRRLALVAANDRGWVPELRSAGASMDEIAAIRAEDRAAQGVTACDEVAAVEALAARRECLGGTLLVIRLPHDRTSAVMDRIALEDISREPPDVLIVSPGELNFSGRGARVLALAERFPDGWFGGALPARGFWGHAAPLPLVKTVLAHLS